MTIKILMPALSPTMTEGSLSKWLIKVGDQVKAGDVLAEIETDKATMEVEAVDEGVVTKLLVSEGESSVAVNTIIAVLNGSDKAENEDNIENERKKKSEDENALNEKIKIQKIQVPAKENFQNKDISFDKIGPTRNFNKKFRASPYAKKIAQQKKIDLNFVKGSGPEGRMIKRDLEDASSLEEGSGIGDTPSAMRKIIAERTSLTKQTVPHFYLTIESNVDSLLAMRKKINNDSEVKISINDILVKALALAQKKNPKSNVSWVDGKIIKYSSVDVSIAVALDEGLITPIVKKADSKGLIEISKEIKNLVNRSKKGKLLPEEYSGGTISISNLGMFGITEFSAIINPPQSSILAVGTIKKTPSVVNDEVKAVNILKSTLSADHRVLDGAVAGKLLKDFHDIIENPFSLWLNTSDMNII
jgi:pyruvate dehydrogenase E2 component (dihydrolipoamide acetyltransferase)